MIDFPAILYHLSIKFLPFYSYTNTKTLLLSRKPLYYHENSQQVSVIITDFCLRVYTIRQKNPRTTIRTFTNVQMPLKAHGNNVTLEPM